MNPLLQEELDEIEQQEAEERQGFRVTDLESLNWVLRKMSAIQAKKNDVDKLVESEKYRIESYRQREHEKLQRDEEYFKSLISEYAAEKRSNDPKFKTEKTPYGSITFKKQQPKWNYDEQKLVAWLRENGHEGLVRTKFEPIKTDLKKSFSVNSTGLVVSPDGEVVDGVMVEVRGDELVIKPEV